MIDFRDLIKAGVHFGHQTARWNPRMAPYIWGSRNGVHLIDVSKTAHHLEQAAKFLEDMAAQDRSILWIGTKKAAQGVITEVAEATTMPRVTHRWVGGTLTNHSQVKKSVTKLLHFEDVIARTGTHHYTKKELTVFQRVVERLTNSVGGIRSLTWPVGAIVVVDIKKEATAIREARVAGIPVIAIVDTNCDPSLIDYVIPANDDSPKSVQFLISYLGQAVQRGLSQVAQEKRDARAARDKKPVNFIEAANAEEIAVAISKAELEEEEQAAARRAAAAHRGAPTAGRRPAMPSVAHTAPAGARPAHRPGMPPVSSQAPRPMQRPLNAAPAQQQRPVVQPARAPEKAVVAPQPVQQAKPVTAAVSAEPKKVVAKPAAVAVAPKKVVAKKAAAKPAKEAAVKAAPKKKAPAKAASKTKTSSAKSPSKPRATAGAKKTAAKKK